MMMMIKRGNHNWINETKEKTVREKILADKSGTRHWWDSLHTFASIIFNFFFHLLACINYYDFLIFWKNESKFSKRTGADNHTIKGEEDGMRRVPRTFCTPQGPGWASHVTNQILPCTFTCFFLSFLFIHIRQQSHIHELYYFWFPEGKENQRIIVTFYI